MNEEYAKLLTTFPLFEGFTAHGAAMVLETGEIKHYAPGEILFREGDPGTFTLLVLEGKLQVFMQRGSQEVTLREFGPGVILGELAVLCQIPRVASVRAQEKTTVLQWPAAEFKRLLLRNIVLNERIMGQSLRTLIEKERALLGALNAAQ